MPENTFRTKLKQGAKPIQAWITNPSILNTEIIGHAGYDSVCIDFQHSAVDFSDLYPMLAALAGGGSTPIVRVPWNEASWIQRVLDAGAMGVICPMIQNRAECETFVGFCKLPPLGRRSPGPLRSRDMAEYMSSANEQIMAIVQIETPESLANIEEILSVPGVDGVFPGLGDYAMAAYGQQMPFTDERLREPITRIIEVAHSKGIPVGLPLLSMDAVRYFDELGLDWFTSGMDMLWVAAGAPRTLQETRAVLQGAAAPAS